MGRPPIPSGVDCYHCGSDKTCKAGMTREKKQRYYCRACRRFSREDPIVPGSKTDYGKRSGGLPSQGHLILQLHAIAQRMKQTPTTSTIAELSKQGRSYSLQTYYAVFGSFLNALKRAKLKPRYKQEFSEEERERMLDELRRLRQRLKRPIYGKDVVAARQKKRISTPFHMARAFGSIPEAIKAAGAGEKRYSREEMIACLRRLDAKLDRCVSKRDIQEEFYKGDHPSFKAIIREFDGIVNARRAAKIRYK